MRQYYQGRKSFRVATFVVVLSSFFYGVLVLPTRGQALPAQLTRPQALPEGSDQEVPVNLAYRIVTDEASGRWARFAVGSPILCSDDNGKLVAYMFPVRLNNDVFPGDRELILSHGQSSETDTLDWGTTDYWTFVVSARERDFPIPCEFNTLPPFFVTAVQAREMAERVLETPEVVLTRFYFLGHRGEYFEFAGAGTTVLIDAYRLTVSDSARTLRRRGEATAALPQVAPENPEGRLSREIYTQQVREEWKRLKERAGENKAPR